MSLTSRSAKAVLTRHKTSSGSSSNRASTLAGAIKVGKVDNEMTYVCNKEHFLEEEEACCFICGY